VLCAGSAQQRELVQDCYDNANKEIVMEKVIAGIVWHMSARVMRAWVDAIHRTVPDVPFVQWVNEVGPIVDRNRKRLV
jgi:hypothetical protein